MTADAKIGLLLGVIFIIMIAFLINGLPDFFDGSSGNEPVETVITIPKASDLVIDDRVFEAVQHLRQDDIPLRQTEPPQEVVVLDDPNPGVHISPAQIAQAAVQVPNDSTEIAAVQTSTPPTRIHVVQSGENLPVIAQKYYGKEEGNRRIVIQKLFEANQTVLDSPGKILVGDKLTIPSLDQLLGTKPRPTVKASGSETSFLQKFSNLFERTDQNRSGKAVRIYIVQKGDSLWGIADTLLGAGNRLHEIQKINPSIKDPDDLIEGMNLKIPNR